MVENNSIEGNKSSSSNSNGNCAVQPMTMSSDPGIICFQHCIPKVFCMDFPKQCPSCDIDLLEAAAFKLMPFRLPFPFVRASQYPGAVVLRPTNGDFLNDYTNSKDLHIGVTTSTGAIVEFDRKGLRKHLDRDAQNRWAQSLLVEQIPEAWYEHWDAILLEICKQSIWNTSSYREDTNNCYSFVLTFLQQLNYGVLSSSASNKTLFCERYIVPRTTAAGKYISLYRKIRDQGLYLHATTTGGSSVGGGGVAGFGSSSTSSTSTSSSNNKNGNASNNNSSSTSTTLVTGSSTTIGMVGSKGAAGTSSSTIQQHRRGGSSGGGMKAGPDRRGGHTSSFNIKGKLCSIRE